MKSRTSMVVSAVILMTSGALAESPARQQAGAGDTAAAVQKGFEEVSGWIVKSAEMVPPDKYSYRPAPTVRAFGQLIAHVIDGNAYFCGRAAGKKVQWSDATEKGPTDKAALVPKLKASMQSCAAVSNAQLPPLIANIAHANLHYGNIITSMRMLGLVPPSS